jgi:hypothetical protein
MIYDLRFWIFDGRGGQDARCTVWGRMPEPRSEEEKILIYDL